MPTILNPIISVESLSPEEINILVKKHIDNIMTNFSIMPKKKIFDELFEINDMLNGIGEC